MESRGGKRACYSVGRAIFTKGHAPMTELKRADFWTWDIETAPTLSPQNARAGASVAAGSVRRPVSRTTKALASMAKVNVAGLIVTGLIVAGCASTRNYLRPRGAVPSSVTPASGVGHADRIEAPSSVQQGTANVATRDVTGLSYSSALPWGMAAYLIWREIGVVIEGYFSHRRRLERISKGLPES